MALCLGIISIIKVPGHSKINSLEAKGNNLIDISTKNTILKGINDQISVLVLGDALTNDNLEELTKMSKNQPREGKTTLEI